MDNLTKNDTSQILKIIQININSLVSKLKRHELAEFIRKNKPHILMLSETHLKTQHNVILEGYKIFRVDRNQTKCGGVAIAIVDWIECEFVEHNPPKCSLECCTIKIKMNNNKNLYICAIYRKPTTKIEKDDISSIFNIEKNAEYVVGGDFNAKSPHWGGNVWCQNGREIYEWMQNNNEKYNVKIMATSNPTCHRSTNGSFIDFAIASDKINFTNINNLNKLPTIDYFSDHSAIIMEIKCEEINKRKQIEVKCYKKANWKKINQFLEKELKLLNIPITDNMPTERIDNACERIEEAFKKAIEKYVPEIKIKHKRIQLSQHTIKLLKEKKNLLRRKHRNRDNANLSQIVSQLKLITQMATNAISEDYRKYWSTELSSIKQDNNIFKHIKRLSTYKSKSEVPHSISNEANNTTYVNDGEKCEALAEQFAKVHCQTTNVDTPMNHVVSEVNKIYEKAQPILQFSEDIPANFVDNELQVTEQSTIDKFISSKELKEIIRSRNNKKSTGSDNMPNYALRKISSGIIYWFVILFNHIINTQHIPKNWKHAIITPIPKPNKNANMIENWRPISQVPTISKCFEKYIDDRMRKACSLKQILDPWQFGFQPGNSTNHAIAKLINDVKDGLNKKTPTIAITIDLQSAFDVMWHDGLIYKLHQMNFEPYIIYLIRNFLSNRTFAVKLNNTLSKPRDIVAGTPQGCIVSALLFILYLNDIPKGPNAYCNIKRLLFADDIVIYSTTKNLAFANTAMNNYLNTLQNYISIWKLKINMKKCEAISFVGHYTDLSKEIRRNALKIKLKIKDEYIKNVKNIKYLGIQITQNLQYNTHVKYIISKAIGAQYLLKNIFNSKYIKKSIKLLCYKQLIRPLLLYGTPCWAIVNLISSYQMEQIRKLERKILRKCCNLYRKPNKKYINSSTLYKSAKINRIDREIVMRNIKFVDKSIIHEKEIVKEIFTEQNLNEVENLKYKPINYYNILNTSNKLYNNKLLLIFNRKKKKTKRISLHHRTEY